MITDSIAATRDFQMIGGSLALDFVNTVGNRLTENREYLTSVSEVTRWADLAGLFSTHRGSPVQEQELSRLVTVREELYAMFHSIAAGSPVSRERLQQLNHRLTALGRLRRIVGRKKEFTWGWQPGISRTEYLLGRILLDAADLLTSGKFLRIRQCSDESCGWLFLDRSPAGKRRWCSMSDCGNRYKARRFYHRERGR